MASFIVMEPPEKPGTDVIKDTIFVRDGFYWLAFILPFIWLFFHRLWFEAAFTLLIMVILGLVGQHTGSVNLVPILSLLISVLVALEGSNWWIWRLRRRGYIEKGVIEAASRSEAEIRYFANSALEKETSFSLQMGSTTGQMSQHDGMFGLVHYRGD